MFRPTLAAALLTLALAAPARAAPYSAIYAFGDSLSDVGNIYAASGNTFPPPPYANGQFTNGPVWLQTVSAGLGLAPLAPSLRGGTDYAYGGAQSGATPVHAANATDLTGAGAQISQYLAARPVSDPAALYTVWVGSNDVNAILRAGLAPAAVGAALGQVAANIESAVVALASTGARNVLVVGVPNLGLTPTVRALGAAAQAGASAASAGLNSLLMNGSGPLPSLSTLAAAYSLNLKMLDTYALLTNAAANPGQFGFTNVTDPCFNQAAQTLCSPTLAGQNQYLFWDDLHPTAAGHAIIGRAALALLDVPENVPEPGSIVLVVGALVVLGARRRANRAA